jgi:hypothetical protein
MGVRTRGLDIKAGAAKLKADKAARLEAELVIDRWNRRLATGCDMLWSPTIRAALIRRNALAGRLLSGLRDQPGDRSADCRPPSAGLGRHAGAGATVLLVSGLGANAKASGAVCPAAGCWRDGADGPFPITGLLAGNRQSRRSAFEGSPDPRAGVGHQSLKTGFDLIKT